MEKITLKAEIRDARKEKNNRLREEGKLPAVIYGKGKESKPLTISAQEFEKVYREAGQSALLDLILPGGTKKVLIQDVSEHPVRGNAEHIDFYEVSMTEKITTAVPLKFVGESTAVVDQSGTLITNKDEVEVECLPVDLPHEIEVDISVLTDFEKSIHVSDIKVPEGVTIKDEIEETIVTVEPPRSEEELAELEEPLEEAEMPESEHGEEGEEAEGEAKEGEEGAAEPSEAEGKEEKKEE
ncbi:MAG: 50S ribosomal protein L25 [Patescibacteria group bacterium]|nr:50S ribosomal protein L25 [Patescibacteria group bacterium]